MATPIRRADRIAAVAAGRGLNPAFPGPAPEQVADGAHAPR